MARPLPVTYRIGPPFGESRQWSRWAWGRFHAAVAFFIYREPVSWASRLTLAGVNWQLPRLFLACNSSDRRLASKRIRYLAIQPRTWAINSECRGLTKQKAPVLSATRA